MFKMFCPIRFQKILKISTVSETFILGVYVVFGWDPVDKHKTSRDSDCGSKKRENSSEFQLGHNVFKIFWSETTENISLSKRLFLRLYRTTAGL